MMIDMIEVSKNDSWHSGIFQVWFFSMGQGDCCLITCPDGRHIVVDCGSKAKDDEDQRLAFSSLVRSVDALNNPKSNKGLIHTLILTHPDIDHYNRVSELLLNGQTYERIPAEGRSYEEMKKGIEEIVKQMPKDAYALKEDIFKKQITIDITQKITVDRVLCSVVGYNTIKKDAPDLSQYDNDVTCGSDLTKHAPTIGIIVINDDHQEAHMYDRSLDEGEEDKWLHNVEKLDKGTFMVAKDLNNVKPEWTVEILAGQVKQKYNGEGTADNTGSLVTLLTHGKHKILICGDATVSTEEYVVSEHAERFIGGVDVMTVPHHGSETSSGSKFIEYVAPSEVVFSVKDLEIQHRLPKLEIVKRYVDAMSEGQDEVRYRGWEKISGNEANRILEDWASEYDKGNLEYEEDEKSFFFYLTWIKGDDDLKKYKGPVAIQGLSASVFALMQKHTKVPIAQTSLHADRPYYIPE